MPIPLAPLRRRLTLAAALAVVPLGAWRAAPEGDVSVERTAWLMGTRASITVEAADRQTGLAATELALRAMRDVEAQLSTWRDDSELARLNRAVPGHRAVASSSLAGLLAETAVWSRQTRGAFHPAVGALVDAWDLRGDGRVPAADALAQALKATGAAGALVDAETGAVVRRHPDAWIDAGAFGKGAALREAGRVLQEAGIRTARIDLGGQLLIVGDTPESVRVAHPTQRRRPAADLTVTNASVATSGQSERGIDVDGVRFGHLLDPRSGRPVPAWGSVTVVHPDPVVADILATALFVSGPDAGLALATSLDVAALFLVADDTGVSQRATPALRESTSIQP